MDAIKQQIAIIKGVTGFSHADIARHLGIPPKTLGDWLLGRTRCRHPQMLALALEALAARWRVDDASNTLIDRACGFTPRTEPSRGDKCTALLLELADAARAWLNSDNFETEEITSERISRAVQGVEALGWYEQGNQITGVR